MVNAKGGAKPSRLGFVGFKIKAGDAGGTNR